MSLSKYPLEPINAIIGQDIEIPVTIEAPAWYSIYDNLVRVRVLEGETEIARTEDIFLLPDLFKDVTITIPGDKLGSGTHILTLSAEERYEFRWYNDGYYNIIVIISGECEQIQSEINIS